MRPQLTKERLFDKRGHPVHVREAVAFLPVLVEHRERREHCRIGRLGTRVVINGLGHPTFENQRQASQAMQNRWILRFQFGRRFEL